MLCTDLEERLFSYRRNMPHWRLKGSTYYATWCLHESQRTLRDEEKSLIASAIKHFDGKRLKLYAYVVMQDHCHTVLSPHESFTLQSLMHSIKSFTANQLQKGSRSGTGQIWQRVL
jgi:REP element-mobilizing transposase RayT